MVVIERSQEYLEHHGILKQKWGVRHGPPYPLDYDDHSRAQKKANPKGDIDNYEGHNEKTGSSNTSSASSPSSSSSSESTRKVETTVEKKEETKVEESRQSSASSEKTKTEKEKTTSKEKEEKEAKERQSLHDKRKAALMEKGLTEEEAENQIKFENRAMAIAAVGALALGATVTYGLVQQRNIDADFTLKGGTNMFRVSTNQDASVQDMFYATTNKADSRKYAGMYAKQLNGELLGYPNGKDVYQKMLSPKNDVRIAGTKTGKRIYEELYESDPDFRKSLTRTHGKWTIGTTYDDFNRHVIMQNKNTGETKKFFDALKAAGYGGIIDINDAKYSGYNATRPVILFGQGTNINVNSVQKLSKQTIQENFDFAQKKITAQNFWRDTKARSLTIAELTGGALAMAGSSYMKSLNLDEMPVPQETNTKKK